MRIGETFAAEIWKIAAVRLSGMVSENLYEQWIANLKPLYLDDACLVLGVANDFLGEWVESSYGSQIAEALCGIAGADYTYRLEQLPEEDIAETEPAADNVSSVADVQESAAASPAVAVAASSPVASPAAAGDDMLLDSSNLRSVTVNGKYTFENFVVGEENRYAYTAARRAAENPGVFNPLYIYGNTGIGKTHLLHAVVHETQKNNPRLVVRYATCEEILNSFVESLQSHRYGAFRSQLRDVDMLLVDDIHVLGSKGQLQEQFFNAFNALYSENKQIILTSDKRPAEIAGLEARLISRFEQGVTTEIYAPGFEVRLAILRNMQRDFTFQFSEEILEFIALRVSSNVRRLRGALMQLLTRVSIDRKTPLTLERVESILHNVFEEEFTSKLITVDDIQKRVAEYFNLRISDLLSNKRPKSIAEPRMVAMYLARKLTDSSFPQIGSAFGRNHATIMNAWTKVPELCEKDEELRRAVAVLERQLKG
ncbi:MAG: chromosomal replication initiator protein DnaA [Lentisphaerae bacterium]|nr:chromosomal replication initiator protein DnaA [Lentisphaerota bacterium]